MYPRRGQAPAKPGQSRAQASSQFATHARSQGAAHSGTQSGYQTRGGLVTPDPAPAPALSFQPGDVVELLTDVNAQFRRGTIVRITAYEQAPMSATQRAGQPLDWQRTDADTLYRFEKRDVAIAHGTALSYDREKSIPHLSLSLQKGGEPDAAGAQWPVGTLLYTLCDYAFRRRDDSKDILVPKGTLCSIQSWTTRKNGVASGRKYPTPSVNNISRYWYVVEATFERPYWVTTPCSGKKDAGHFRKLTPEEKRAYDRAVLPPPRVIPWGQASRA